MIPDMPMPIDMDRSAQTRWLEKPVLETRPLADMEILDRWTGFGPSNIELSSERCMDGTSSLRVSFPTVQEDDRSKNVDAGVSFEVDAEDWSAYNRISFWVYSSQKGFPANTMFIALKNESEVPVPDMYKREGRHFFVLRPDEWNHVVWEIANLARDRVTGIDFAYHQHGLPPGGGLTGCYDIDRLELQVVDADHFEGWSVAPGRISYSHSGYRTGLSKSAIGGGLAADSFALIDTDSGDSAFRGRIEKRETALGVFQIMDFSEVDRAGMYRLDVGGTQTDVFPISEDVWTHTAWKIINFLYCQRCGPSVPTVHGPCHGDVLCEHNGQTIVVNGGWHDAGDLSQMIAHTAPIVYTLFGLADKLAGSAPDLSARLIVEARWGLDYVLKTRFGDGYRVDTRPLGVWTDGIIGTDDDKITGARNTPFENFISSAGEVAGWRALKHDDPTFAAYCLDSAIDDWNFAMEQVDQLNVDISGVGGLASLDLYSATGGDEYLEQAMLFAGTIVDSQQKAYPDWDIPLTGFFYKDPSKRQILRYNPRSQMHLPIVLLERLCRLLPDHPDWMRWYGTVARYAEYLKSAAAFTQPYGMIPSSIYALDETHEPGIYSNQENLFKYRDYENDVPQYTAQVKNGVRLGPNHYLRRFPVWYGHRGNYGIILSEGKALSTAAHLRGDRPALDLAQAQLAWVVGKNPFCQSTIYGEGYDYPPLYTPSSGHMVGGMPVGIRTKRNGDEPYWPATACYNYKEVWVDPVSRWLWLLEDFVVLDDFAEEASPVEGTVIAGAVVENEREQVRLSVTVTGNGGARLQVRGDNLGIESPEKLIDLTPGRETTVVWTARVLDVNSPWIAVVISDGDISRRKEISNFASR